MNKDTKGRLDPYKMVEERLGEFEKRVSEMEEKMSRIEDKTKNSFDKYAEYIKSLNNILSYDMVIEDWFISLDGRDSGSTSSFDFIVKGIKEKTKAEEQIKELGLTVSRLSVEKQIRDIIRIARKWKICFEDIAPYLIHSFGKEEARKLVRKEDLMQYYGKKIIPIWESLLKE